MSAQDDPLDSRPKDRNVEIDEQAELAPHGFEIRNHLRFVNRGKGFYRLQFDQKLPSYYQVNTPLTHRAIFVHYRKGFLPLKWDPASRQFNRQRFLVNALQKARPQGSLDLYGCINHGLRQDIHLG
jgi:hypothetical protein